MQQWPHILPHLPLDASMVSSVTVHALYQIQLQMGFDFLIISPQSCTISVFLLCGLIFSNLQLLHFPFYFRRIALFIFMGLSCWLGWNILKIGEGYLLKADIPPGSFFSLNSQMDLTNPKKNEVCYFEFQDCYLTICPATSCHAGNNHHVVSRVFPVYMHEFSRSQSPVSDMCHQCSPENSQNVCVLLCCPSNRYWDGWNSSWIRLANMKILAWRRPHLILPDQVLKAPPTFSVLVWWLIITHTLSDAIYLLPGNAPMFPLLIFLILSDCPS